jgi:CMP-N,N'-diacetyllegionaminic acid synthase
MNHEKLLHNVIALIPARAGSKRVPDKNVRRLGAHPALAYAIAAARESRIFSDIVVSTDSPEYANIARHYGAEVPFLRPEQIAGDKSPDIEWVEFTLQELQKAGREYSHFSILRPTNPFRQATTIQRAWNSFRAQEGVDSLRAVEKCAQHPGKMWVVRGSENRARMTPLLPLGPKEQPWHSSQYASLPEVWVQNASLEIANTRCVFEDRSIAGNVLMPFFTDELEGFDINSPYDWRLAEEMVSSGEAVLPHVEFAPYK